MNETTGTDTEIEAAAETGLGITRIGTKNVTGTGNEKEEQTEIKIRIEKVNGTGKGIGTRIETKRESIKRVERVVVAEAGGEKERKVPTALAATSTIGTTRETGMTRKMH